MNLILLALAAFPNDSGPIYQETIAGRFPVEPYNTFSNFLFLAIVIYFSVKVYGNYRQQRFLAFSLPVIFLGFIGGTVYHATRSHPFWLYLDWVPIMLLCFAVSIYFILKVDLKKRKKAAMITVVLLLIFGTKFLPWSPKIENSAEYIGTSLGLLLPLVVYLIRTHFRFSKYIFLAFGSFGVAITFRTLDRFLYFLPMGTHWLWHSFGALAVFFLVKYIYLDKEAETREEWKTADFSASAPESNYLKNQRVKE
ncbi:MAG: hypothetical protein WBV47_05780 [Salegentibacter sp.]